MATKLRRLKPALEHCLQPQLQMGLNYVRALLDNAANSIQVQLLENKLMMLVGQMTSVFSPRCAPEPPPA